MMSLKGWFHGIIITEFHGFWYVIYIHGYINLQIFIDSILHMDYMDTIIGIIGIIIAGTGIVWYCEIISNMNKYDACLYHLC